jgi:hypothetical protein
MPVQNSVTKVLKPIFAKKRKTKADFLILENLSKNWQQIVGQQCYEMCFAKNIKFSRAVKAAKNNGTLTISANSSAVGFFLEANSSQIIENIASYYGYKIISKINIVQELRMAAKKKQEASKIISATAQKTINSATQEIADENLKLTLQKLGTSILK